MQYHNPIEPRVKKPMRSVKEDMKFTSFNSTVEQRDVTNKYAKGDSRDANCFRVAAIRDYVLELEKKPPPDLPRGQLRQTKRTGTGYIKVPISLPIDCWRDASLWAKRTGVNKSAFYCEAIRRRIVKCMKDPMITAAIRKRNRRKNYDPSAFQAVKK